MKFGQLIERNMRNIFLEKSYKCRGETSRRPFFEKSKLSISLEQQSEMLIQFIFIACPCRGLPKSIETKVLTTCFYVKALYKAFLKSKKKSGTRHLIFCMIFEEECF